MKQFQIGIVGAGLIAREHCLSLSRLPQTRGLLFFDSDEGRAKALASEFSGQSAASLGELIQASDLVWLCTPPNARRQAIELACAAGRAIFCEKPLAITADEIGWIRQTVRAAGVPFFMGQSNRFGSYFMKMRELVEQGAVGELTSIWSNRRGWLDVAKNPAWRVDDQRGGGTMVELGVHEIDFTRWIAGDWQNVFARGSSKTVLPGRFLDSISAIGEMDNGVTARLDVSWASPRYLWQRGVEGTTGSLFFDDVRVYQIELHRPNREPEIFQTGDWQDKATRENLSLRAQAMAVLAALEARSSPPVTLDDGAQAIRVALAIRESIDRGQSVNLNTIRAS